MSDEHPLPDGWIKEFDRISNHPFWVDTKANPPRSIWVHPYEDEQYLSEHPEIKGKLGLRSVAPPPYDERPRRHSFSGTSSGDMIRRGPGAPPPVAATRKRGFFGKLKDKAIGTKEEREAERLRIEEMRAQRREQFLAQQAARQAYYAQQQQQQQQFDGGYGPPMAYRQRGFGGGGVAVPLLGGLAGGLLLGDVLGGGFGGGFDGGFGGGFDGGDFGGGGFDGGF